MPRRHPKQEETHRGPSPARLTARRERRKARREAKSRPLPSGLLTVEERATLTSERRYLRGLSQDESLSRQARERIAAQLRNVESEIEADLAAAKAARSRRA